MQPQPAIHAVFNYCLLILFFCANEAEHISHLRIVFRLKQNTRKGTSEHKAFTGL